MLPVPHIRLKPRSGQPPQANAAPSCPLQSPSGSLSLPRIETRMRSHVIPAVGLVFGLLFLAPLVRGDGQPDAKAPAKGPATPAGKAAVELKLPPAVELPITRVVLFNAGIGYFHREGDVTGEGRLELRFDEADVNDLLKSLVLTDKDGGKVRAVTYDNRMPLEFTLKGFSVDVTENPTVGQLMHQVRGEKVEVTDKGGVVTAGS